MVRECLFPVAGLGTRFLPATKETPKEMMPLLDRPIIHYGVQEAVDSGCDRMVMVTSRTKSSIENYFDRSLELEETLEERKKTELLTMVRKISTMAEILSTRQMQPLGLGHAVLCGEGLVSGDYFGVILPDDVMEGNPPVLAQLIEVHNRLGGSCIALEEVPMDQVSRYGVACGRQVEAGVMRLDGLVEKPPVEKAPSNLAVMGRYVLSRRVFEILKHTPRGAGGEIQLTDALQVLAKEEALYGVVYKGARYDCGTIEGWLAANVRKAMSQPKYRTVIEEAYKMSIR